MVERAAAGLQKLGVKKGTKVGLFMPNCPTFIVYYFATLKAGGTVVNYNPLYTLEELTFQVKDSETELMVTLDLKLLFDKVEGLMKAGTLKRAIVASFPALLPGAKSVLYKLFKGKDLAHPMKSPVAANIIADADVRKNDGKYQKQAIDPLNDVAVLQYTGGTTGKPKGAMLTHGNLSAACSMYKLWSDPQRMSAPGEDKVICVLPLFLIFALTSVMLRSLYEGNELLLRTRFDVATTLDDIEVKKATVFRGVPTMWIALANTPDIDKRDFSSLRYAASGGAALPVEVAERFQKLTGQRLGGGWGMTETSPAGTALPKDCAHKPGSVGLPLPGILMAVELPGGEHNLELTFDPELLKIGTVISGLSAALCFATAGLALFR
jgi:long-chain acyl-CoA synthetase